MRMLLPNGKEWPQTLPSSSILNSLLPIRNRCTRKTNNQYYAILHTVSSGTHNKPTLWTMHEDDAHDQLKDENDANVFCPAYAQYRGNSPENFKKSNAPRSERREAEGS